MKMKKIIASVLIGATLFTGGIAVQASGLMKQFTNMFTSPDVIYINGQQLDMTDPANGGKKLETAIDTSVNRTYVPLRKVAEATGAEVKWQSGRIDINTKEADVFSQVKGVSLVKIVDIGTPTRYGYSQVRMEFSNGGTEVRWAYDIGTNLTVGKYYVREYGMLIGNNREYITLSIYCGD